jgi:fumarylpyruvate hydrolase
MSELVAASEIGHLDQGRITMTVNGTLQQNGDLNQMIWKVPEMITYLSRFYDIAAGDLIMSGTPAGVGPIKRGDIMVGEVEQIGSFTVVVA